MLLNKIQAVRLAGINFSVRYITKSCSWSSLTSYIAKHAKKVLGDKLYAILLDDDYFQVVM